MQPIYTLCDHFSFSLPRRTSILHVQMAFIVVWMKEGVAVGAFANIVPADIPTVLCKGNLISHFHKRNVHFWLTLMV